MAKIGRPGGPTDEIIEQVVGFLTRGATQRSAFAAVGVSASTQARWLARGRDHADDDPIPEEHEVYVRLVLAVDAAVGAFRAGLAEKLVIAGDKDWRAWAKVLTATDPEWRTNGGGMTVTTNVGVGVGQITGSVDREEDLLREIDRIAERFELVEAKSCVRFTGRYSGTVTFDTIPGSRLPKDAHLVMDRDGARIEFDTPPAPPAPRALPAPERPVVEVIDVEPFYRPMSV